MGAGSPEFHCPHCGRPLDRIALPDNSGWDELQHQACFNDECGYYQRGWTWMMEQFGVRASYRYRLDPATGQTTPLPVWSPTALRDRVVDQGGPGSAAGAGNGHCDPPGAGSRS